MLCTNCSEKVKPIVAIDIDGTLAMFHEHFWDFLRMYLGVPIPDKTFPYSGRESFKEWGMRSYNIDERTWYDIKLAFRQGAQKRMMPIYPDARGLTYYCRKHGAEVWLATTRPFNRLDNIDPDTRAWCTRHDIYFDYMISHEDKYRELAERVDPTRVAAVLDDLVEQCHIANMLFGSQVPILRRNKFNAATRFPSMAINLHNAWEMIRQRLWMWENRSELFHATLPEKGK